MDVSQLRWGVLGTANIARASFLPALGAIGGSARAVASRDPERARAFAAANGIPVGCGYDELLGREDVDVVYIPLPNALHREWTIRALRAGKAVLCEKPLCPTAAEVAEVLSVAEETEVLLWEAFVFPFHRQFERVAELLAAGAIGELREIHASFHFLVRKRENIRFRPELGGGALNDVGCYAVHLARLLFQDEPGGARAAAAWAPEGVDEEMQGILLFPGGRRLIFTCGMSRPYDTFTRLVGTHGEIRLTNPFHPGPDDVLELRGADGVRVERLGDEPSFAPALRHIERVVAGQEEPRHLARQDALGTARAMEQLRIEALRDER